MAVAALSLGSCSDFLDKQSAAYDSDGFYQSEAGLNEGVTGIYRPLLYSQNWDVPTIMVQDTYSPYGIDQYENNGINNGCALTPDNSNIATYWKGHWSIVQRANNVIAGAKTDPNVMSATYKRRLAEAYVLRAYGYYQLVQAFGDIPFFKTAVNPDDYKAPRTDKKEIIDFLVNELNEIGESEILPWSPEAAGRVSNGAVYNLIARFCLLVGSVNVGGQAKEYFGKAADAAKKVMDKTGLANNYEDLFTHAGHAKADVKKEILWQLSYSDGAVRLTHRTRYGHTSRTAGGSSVRFPSVYLEVCFECKDGKRIDESELYDPKKPFMNRDPRMKETMLMHGDTMTYNEGKNKIELNLYAKNSQQFPNPKKPDKWYAKGNPDVTGTGITFAWDGIGHLYNKYNRDLSESFSESTIGLIVMRAAEAYLTYAEAKIEMGELDQSVYDAINAVRTRAGMPKFDASREGNQDKMRQLVRRERKVELAMEGITFTDFRRWGIGDILNEGPVYGQPIKDIQYTGLTKADMPSFKKSDRHDLNDVPDFSAVADKYTSRDSKRFWAPRFQWWPIPRADLDKNPNLTNPDGY